MHIFATLCNRCFTFSINSFWWQKTQFSNRKKSLSSVDISKMAEWPDSENKKSEWFRCLTNTGFEIGGDIYFSLHYRPGSLLLPEVFKQLWGIKGGLLWKGLAKGSRLCCLCCSGNHDFDNREKAMQRSEKKHHSLLGLLHDMCQNPIYFTMECHPSCLWHPVLSEWFYVDRPHIWPQIIFLSCLPHLFCTEHQLFCLLQNVNMCFIPSAWFDCGDRNVRKSPVSSDNYPWLAAANTV